MATKRFLVFLPEHPSLAAGPDDVLYAVWNSGQNDDDDVFLRRSDDGGATWGDAVRVNDTRQAMARISTCPGSPSPLAAGSTCCSTTGATTRPT
ncbi:hypothetical protein BH20ACT1_BH20ACT1_09570 [soil metagenome]